MLTLSRASFIDDIESRQDSRSAGYPINATRLVPAGLKRCQLSRAWCICMRLNNPLSNAHTLLYYPSLPHSAPSNRVTLSSIGFVFEFPTVPLAIISPQWLQERTWMSTLPLYIYPQSILYSTRLILCAGIGASSIPWMAQNSDLRPLGYGIEDEYTCIIDECFSPRCPEILACILLPGESPIAAEAAQRWWWWLIDSIKARTIESWFKQPRLFPGVFTEHLGGLTIHHTLQMLSSGKLLISFDRYEPKAVALVE